MVSIGRPDDFTWSCVDFQSVGDRLSNGRQSGTASCIASVEVKASATVSESDFAGLRRLAAATRDSFALGLVLYDHEHAVPFGERMAAAPLSTLWS